MSSEKIISRHRSAQKPYNGTINLEIFYANTLKSRNIFLFHRIIMYKTLRTLFLLQVSVNHISVMSANYLSNIPCLFYCQIKSFEDKFILRLKLIKVLYEQTRRFPSRWWLTCVACGLFLLYELSYWLLAIIVITATGKVENLQSM